jgi:hypothetical protein
MKDRQMNKNGSTEGQARKSNGQVEELAGPAPEYKQASVSGLYDPALGDAASAFVHAKGADLGDALKVAKDAAEGVAGTDFGALREDLVRLTHSIGQLVQNQAATTGAHVMDAVGVASDNISESASMAQDQLMSIEAGLETRIQKNPWAPSRSHWAWVSSSAS